MNLDVEGRKGQVYYTKTFNEDGSYTCNMYCTSTSVTFNNGVITFYKPSSWPTAYKNFSVEEVFTANIVNYTYGPPYTLIDSKFKDAVMHHIHDETNDIRDAVEAINAKNNEQDERITNIENAIESYDIVEELTESRVVYDDLVINISVSTSYDDTFGYVKCTFSPNITVDNLRPGTHYFATLKFTYNGTVQLGWDKYLDDNMKWKVIWFGCSFYDNTCTYKWQKARDSCTGYSTDSSNMFCKNLRITYYNKSDRVTEASVNSITDNITEVGSPEVELRLGTDVTFTYALEGNILKLYFEPMIHFNNLRDCDGSICYLNVNQYTSETEYENKLLFLIFGKTGDNIWWHDGKKYITVTDRGDHWEWVIGDEGFRYEIVSCGPHDYGIYKPGTPDIIKASDLREIIINTIYPNLCN